MIEASKLVLYFIYEFFFSQVYVLLLVFMIQSVLRAVVCANLYVKQLIITNRESRKRTFLYAYYSVIVVIYVVLIALSFASQQAINCISDMYSKYLH